MGFAAGVASLTVLSVTIRLLIFSACHGLPRTSLKSCRECSFPQIDIRERVEELSEREWIVAVKGPGKLVSRCENLFYHCISGPVSGQSLCIPWERQTQSWMCLRKEQSSITTVGFHWNVSHCPRKPRREPTWCYDIGMQPDIHCWRALIRSTCCILTFERQSLFCPQLCLVFCQNKNEIMRVRLRILMGFKALWCKWNDCWWNDWKRLLGRHISIYIASCQQCIWMGLLGHITDCYRLYWFNLRAGHAMLRGNKQWA